MSFVESESTSLGYREGIIQQDTRLAKAVNIARLHLAEHSLPIPPLESLRDEDYQQFADATNSLMAAVAEGVSPATPYRRVEKDFFKDMINMVTEENGAPIILLIRHGEQDFDESAVSGISDPGERTAWKNILRLQRPANAEDPMTDQSVIESFSAYALRIVSDATGYTTLHNTTGNRRGEQAAALAAILNEAPLTHRFELDCIDLLPGITPGDKGLNPDGTLMWNEKSADATCGEGSFLRLQQGMLKVFNDAWLGNMKTLTINHSHTQQLGFGQTVGKLPNTRLNHHAIVALPLYGQARVFDENYLRKAA